MNELEIARAAARNIQRKYALFDWSAEDLEDAAGWGALAQVEAADRIASADAPERYAFGVAQREIITAMLRGRQYILPLEDWTEPIENTRHSAAYEAQIAELLCDFSDIERDIYVARVTENLSRGKLADRFGIGFWDVHRILQRCRKRLARRVAA